MNHLHDQKSLRFDGLRVAAFESRHRNAMEQLILNHGGRPLVAPALREVPIDENKDAFAFAAELFSGRVDMVVFLTGVGTRFLTQVIETKYSHAAWVEALSRIIIVARGPKPVAALFELGVPIHVRAPEPNTWVELLIALDEAKEQVALAGCRIAVQEYGISNRELIGGLEARGAIVQPVPVYQWALPLDLTPLREAIAAMIMDQIQVLLFTTSVQVIHVMKVAAEMGLETILRQAIGRMIIASIGPTTSEALANYGLKADIEPSHPKMGILVKEAAESSLELLVRKKMRASQYSTRGVHAD